MKCPASGNGIPVHEIPAHEVEYWDFAGKKILRPCLKCFTAAKAAWDAEPKDYRRHTKRIQEALAKRK